MAAEQEKRIEQKSAQQNIAETSKDKRGEYLTARQLAEVLQISESTVHRLRRSGRIPAILLTDRLIRFNLRDVQKSLRPTNASRASSDGEDPGADDNQPPSPQLSFDDFFNRINKI